MGDQSTTFLDQDDFPRPGNMPQMAAQFRKALERYREANGVSRLTDLPLLSSHAVESAKLCYEKGMDAISKPPIGDLAVALVSIDIIGEAKSGYEILQRVITDTTETEENQLLLETIEGADGDFCGVGMYGTVHEMVLFFGVIKESQETNKIWQQASVA